MRARWLSLLNRERRFADQLEDPPPEESSLMTRSAWTATALAVLALAGCSSDAAAEDVVAAAPSPVKVSATPTPTPTPKTITVKGYVEVPGVVTAGYFSCGTDGGYKDIREGSQVVVTDSAGATIALGALETGLTLATDVPEGSDTPCTFLFEVAGVPADEAFYGVEISHRGVVQYAAADVKKDIALTLG